MADYRKARAGVDPEEGFQPSSSAVSLVKHYFTIRVHLNAPVYSALINHSYCDFYFEL